MPQISKNGPVEVYAIMLNTSLQRSFVLHVLTLLASQVLGTNLNDRKQMARNISSDFAFERNALLSLLQ